MHDGLFALVRRLVLPLLLAGVLVLGLPVRAIAQPARVPARVLAVIDGDTIEVLVDGRRERVRYIGIDTPEVWPQDQIECYGPEASARNYVRCRRVRRTPTCCWPPSGRTRR